MNLSTHLQSLTTTFIEEIISAVLRGNLTDLVRESDATGKELHVRLAPQPSPKGKRGRKFGDGVIGRALVNLGGSATGRDILFYAVMRGANERSVQSMLTQAVKRGHVRKTGKNGSARYELA